MQTSTENSNEKTVVETEEVPATSTPRQPDHTTDAKRGPPADCETGNGTIGSPDSGLSLLNLTTAEIYKKNSEPRRSRRAATLGTVAKMEPQPCTMETC